ncbi:MAG TPA: ABC transporter substrate-binding protein [Pseudolabrys sp.]|nr:ABC transporter substrate-binding protein [Pseudolabrys sp.]
MSLISDLSRRHFLAGTGLAALGVSVGAPFVHAQSLKPVSFRLNYVANAEHAPYYVGVKKGFYKEAGLDVTIAPGTGSNDTVKLVGAGNDMFGVAVADAVLVGRGRGVPVVSTAVLLQQSPNVLASLTAKNITKPEDLLGKKVGMSSRSTVFAFWKAFVKETKLDETKIQFSDLGATASSPVLIAGTIDATITLATNEVVALREDGVKLNTLDLGEYGVRSYGQTLFANDNLTKKDSALVKAFTAATLKAWEYTIANVPEAIAILKESVPETEVKKEIAKWTEITPRTKALKGDVAFGSQTAEGWASTYATFSSAGLIDTAFDPASIMAKPA